MVDQEIRRNLRLNLFSSVGELADLDHQRATWLDPEMQNPHFSFNEFLECFYDVAGGDYDADNCCSEDAPLYYLVEEGYITGEERDAVWPLHIALRNYKRPTNRYDHKAILSDPAWQLVTQAAVKAKEEILGRLEDGDERAAFLTEDPPLAQKRWP